MKLFSQLPLWLVLCASVFAVGQGGELTVAAASDLQPVMQQMQADFEHDTGVEVRFVYGASGNLFMQIENGAPYDVFLSADMNYPQRLVAAHWADPATLHRYAVGRLVLWAAPGSGLDVKQLGMRALLDPAVGKVAIANPQHAPYGQAAVAAMKSAHLYDHVKGKLVVGENVVQAAQFVRSGNAQLGLVALPLVIGLPQGSYVEVPLESYPAIDQGLVVLKNAKNRAAADQFVEYMKKMRTVMLLKRYGFEEAKTLQR